MSRILATSIAIIFVVFVIVNNCQTDAQVKNVKKIDDIIKSIKKRDCGINAHFSNSRGNERCINNCANYENGHKFCTKELYFGSFCVCDTGFIFLNGTDGDCVRAKDCPK